MNDVERDKAICEIQELVQSMISRSELIAKLVEINKGEQEILISRANKMFSLYRPAEPSDD